MVKYLRGGIGLLAMALGVTGAIAQGVPQIAEDGQEAAVEGAQANAAEGPVRLARLSFIKGQVSWRENSDSTWTDATPNMPLREGAQIWTTDRARAEIQFDDGSYLRLGGVRRDEGGVITLQTMFSDAQGEFTEIALNSGLLSLKLTNATSLYQVDTEILAAKAYGPADLRVGEGRGVEVVDHRGAVNVKNKAGEVTDLKNAESVYVSDGSAPLAVASMPGMDSWDQFVAERDSAISGPVTEVPSNIALWSGDLNGNGSWQPSESGNAWYPNVEANWAPYRDGRWVWVRPFGWTWCANESWGWAPYHYGTWIHNKRGWAWVPGPATQCWSPAVVHFATENGRIVWCPLAPNEVRYQNSTVGVWRNGWIYSYAVGSIGSYYPSRDNVCDPRYFRNGSVNHFINTDPIGNLGATYGSEVVTTNHFVPINARHGFGASTVAVGDFGRLTHISTWRDSSVFDRGQSLAPRRERPITGPSGVKVTQVSSTPTQSPSEAQPVHTIFERSIFRPKMPANGFERHVPTPSTVPIRRVAEPVKAPVINRPPPVQTNPALPSNGFSGGSTPVQRRTPLGPVPPRQKPIISPPRPAPAQKRVNPPIPKPPKPRNGPKSDRERRHGN